MVSCPYVRQTELYDITERYISVNGKKKEKLKTCPYEHFAKRGKPVTFSRTNFTSDKNSIDHYHGRKFDYLIIHIGKEFRG